MYAAHSLNERAWRQYSFINFTIFDILKYLTEGRDLGPKHFKVSLWDKMEFIRREHKYNLEILKRLNATKIDLDKYFIDKYEMENKYAMKKIEEERSKITKKKLKEIRRKFRGNFPPYFKLLFKKLHVPIDGSTKTSQELVNMICDSKENF